MQTNVTTLMMMLHGEARGMEKMILLRPCRKRHAAPFFSWEAKAFSS
jgi:hypothetical protein